MPDWEKIYNFIARREENNDDAYIVSEMRRLPPEDREAFLLALDLFDLMKEYNITQEEARNVYELKEDLKINDWQEAWNIYEFKEDLKINDRQEAWRLYNEGGVIRREQNITENTQRLCNKPKDPAERSIFLAFFSPFFRHFFNKNALCCPSLFAHLRIVWTYQEIPLIQ